MKKLIIKKYKEEHKDTAHFRVWTRFLRDCPYWNHKLIFNLLTLKKNPTKLIGCSLIGLYPPTIFHFIDAMFLIKLNFNFKKFK